MIQKKIFSFRLDPDTIDELREVARLEQITIGALLRDIIDEYFDVKDRSAVEFIHHG